MPPKETVKQMKLALHIFSKDVRHLRGEIAFFLVLTTLFPVASSGPLGEAIVVILIIGAIHLTSRVVHAEPIPGTGQFWITRPYPWKSLLTSKLLFIAVWIVAPIGIARFAKLAIQGYPLASSLPPLLWSELLLFAALLPIGALAALTSGIMEFSIGMLGLAVAYLLATFVLPLAVHVLLVWPVSVEWVQNSGAFLLLTGVAAVVLFWQYRYRRTGPSRILTAAGAIAAVAFYVAIPASAGLLIQTWLSHGGSLPLSFAPDTTRKITLPGPSNQDVLSGTIRLPLAIAIGNLPKGDEVAVDSLHISLDWPDGKHWEGPASVAGSESETGRESISGSVRLPDRTYNTEAPVRMRGSLYLTLVGDTESRTIPFTSTPTNAQDGLQCFNGFQSQSRVKSAYADYSEDFSSYFCRAFFGWPSRIVSAKAANLESGFTRLVSYSPFPSGVDLDSAESRYVSLITARANMTTPIHDVIIVTKKPLAHLHRDFDFPNVRMSDFQPPRPWFMMPAHPR